MIKRKNIFQIYIHGWRGVTNRIVIKAVNELVDIYNCNLDDLIICVSPCLCKNCFKVHDDVKQIFEKEFENEIKDSNIIEKIEIDRYIIDLQEILHILLINTGINEKNIHFANICTCCNSEDFYSYRKNEITGRMANFIMLK